MPQTPSEPESFANSAKVREEAGHFVLPEFESLPAAAGLDNLAAFRLSIRHALALLPAIWAKGVDDQVRRDNPERFSIR